MAVYPPPFFLIKFKYELRLHNGLSNYKMTGHKKQPDHAVRARCLLIGSDSIEKRIMKSFEVQESRGDLFEPIGRSEIEEVTVYDVVNKNQYLRFERAVYQLCPVSTRKFNLKSRKSGRTWKEEECTWKFHPGATSDYRAQLKELEG